MPANEFNFTKASIEKLPIPKDGQRVRYYDAKQKGLCLRVTSNGVKSFTYYRKYQGKVYSKKLGEFPAYTIDKARHEAAALNVALGDGKNPFEQALAEANEMTLGELFDAYIEQYARERCTTSNDMVANFNRYFGDWHNRRLSSFTKIEIQTKINRLSANGKKSHTANRSHDLLRAVFQWGIKKALYAKDNPCAGIDRFKVQSRERFLKPGEFKAFFEALAEEKGLNDNFHDYVLLSLFTGARQANVLAMRWDQLDLDAGTWRIPKTKNKDSHTIPLTPYALEILRERATNADGPFVFPSDSAAGHYTEPKVAWRQLLKRAELSDLRMHDLRRTMGSYMAMNNQSLPIIGKALGHKSQTSTQIYARLDLDPVRLAMEQAQALMLSIGGIRIEDFYPNKADQ